MTSSIINEHQHWKLFFKLWIMPVIHIWMIKGFHFALSIVGHFTAKFSLSSCRWGEKAVNNTYELNYQQYRFWKMKNAHHYFFLLKHKDLCCKLLKLRLCYYCWNVLLPCHVAVLVIAKSEASLLHNARHVWCSLHIMRHVLMFLAYNDAILMFLAYNEACLMFLA